MKNQELKNIIFNNDDDFEESLVKVIADPIFNKIIRYVKKNPASINEISKELRLDKTILRKKVNILLKLCLIEIVPDTKFQGRTTLYTSSVQDIFIEFKNKKLDVKISKI